MGMIYFHMYFYYRPPMQQTTKLPPTASPMSSVPSTNQKPAQPPGPPNQRPAPPTGYMQRSISGPSSPKTVDQIARDLEEPEADDTMNNLRKTFAGIFGSMWLVEVARPRRLCRNREQFVVVFFQLEIWRYFFSNSLNKKHNQWGVEWFRSVNFTPHSFHSRSPITISTDGLHTTNVVKSA